MPSIQSDSEEICWNGYHIENLKESNVECILLLKISPVRIHGRKDIDFTLLVVLYNHKSN